MITPPMKRALKRFEEAVKEKAWIGSKHPEDQKYIEEEYQEAKRGLEQCIERMGTFKYRKGYEDGKEDTYSRVANKPGDGDMGG